MENPNRVGKMAEIPLVWGKTGFLNKLKFGIMGRAKNIIINGLIKQVTQRRGCTLPGNVHQIRRSRNGVKKVWRFSGGF